MACPACRVAAKSVVSIRIRQLRRMNGNDRGKLARLDKVSIRIRQLRRMNGPSSQLADLVLIFWVLFGTSIVC